MHEGTLYVNVSEHTRDTPQSTCVHVWMCTSGLVHVCGVCSTPDEEVSQRRTVLSTELALASLSSESKAKANTGPACPDKVREHWPAHCE